MYSTPILVGTAVLFVAIGALLGALFWQRDDSERPAEMGLPFWDAHSVFNSMHRLALEADRGEGMTSDTLYNLSDHLLQGVLFQREAGWVGRESIEAWVLSYVRVLADLRGQEHLPVLDVHLDASIQRVDAACVVRQLIWRLQKTQLIEAVRISIDMDESREGSAVGRLEVVGVFEELGHGGADLLSSTWRIERGSCTCEVKVRCVVYG